MQDNISFFSILSLAIFVVPILIINNKIGLKMNKAIIYSILRMTVQLTLVGLFLKYIFELNNPFINIGYLMIMIIVASYTAIKSCKFDFRKYIILIILSFIIPTFILVMYFNTFVIRIDRIFDARFIITIGGMLLGNCLSGNITCINYFFTQIKENKQQYEYSLSMSTNRYESLRPYLKDAIFISVNPTIATIETAGLVALPGMMTGQILGGNVPFTAIKYQIAIMIAILIARYFSALLTLVLTIRKSFDQYDVYKS